MTSSGLLRRARRNVKPIHEDLKTETRKERPSSGANNASIFDDTLKAGPNVPVVPTIIDIVSPILQSAPEEEPEKHRSSQARSSRGFRRPRAFSTLSASERTKRKQKAQPKHTRENSEPNLKSSTPREEDEDSGTRMPHGILILWRFLTGLGPLTNANLAENLRGETTHIAATDMWSYRLDQGCTDKDRLKLRDEISPRLYRVGGKLHGPSWARVVLGPEFSSVPSQTQRHDLTFTLHECACLKCKVQMEKDEQDCPSVCSFDEILEERQPGTIDRSKTEQKVGKTTSSAERSGGIEQECASEASRPSIAIEVSSPTAALLERDHGKALNSRLSMSARAHLGSQNAVTQSFQETNLGKAIGGNVSNLQSSVPLPTAALPTPRPKNWTIPSLKDLSLIGTTMSEARYEIGIVTKLASRTGARMFLSESMQRFAGHGAYTGGTTLFSIGTQVAKKGHEYYAKHKGKKERKVYVSGDLVRIEIPLSAFVVKGKGLRHDEADATHILARPQVLNVFIGKIALEGSFDSIIETDIPMYLGFGDDDGAQPVLPSGALGSPRPLGVNEACSHMRDTAFSTGSVPIYLR